MRVIKIDVGYVAIHKVGTVNTTIKRSQQFCCRFVAMHNELLSTTTQFVKVIKKIAWWFFAELCLVHATVHVPSADVATVLASTPIAFF